MKTPLLALIALSSVLCAVPAQAGSASAACLTRDQIKPSKLNAQQKAVILEMGHEIGEREDGKKLDCFGYGEECLTNEQKDDAIKAICSSAANDAGGKDGAKDVAAADVVRDLRIAAASQKPKISAALSGQVQAVCAKGKEACKELAPVLGEYFKARIIELRHKNPASEVNPLAELPFTETEKPLMALLDLGPVDAAAKGQIADNRQWVQQNGGNPVAKAPVKVQAAGAACSAEGEEWQSDCQGRLVFTLSARCKAIGQKCGFLR